jgi:serine/threonine protein phosphatase PrpC
MITTYGICSLKGSKHHLNEDRYRLLGGNVPLVRTAGRGELYAVIDGVGGAPRGRAAAQHIADRLLDFYDRADIHATKQGLRELLTAMNDEVHAWGMIEGTDRPLGAAAMTIAWFAPSQEVVIFHVGDTLGLHFDGEGVTKLTRDHSEGRGLRHYVGQGAQFILEERGARFLEGDTLCLVTDGVTKVMRIDEIQHVLAEFANPQRAADEIAQRARGKRSPDDITALVVQLEEW